ncbi:helicase [Spirochaetia bacterium]|nr:helicase [Spirochaetia bacterium]
MQAAKRISETVIQYLRAEILDAGGNEIFALGWQNDQGLVVKAEVRARGNEVSVLVLRDRLESFISADTVSAPGSEEAPTDVSRPSDVLIHNHPSGFLTPSDNDMAIASLAAESGTGSFIIDNEVKQVYVVAEPTRRKAVKKLNANRICAALEEGGAIAKRLSSFEIRPSQLDLMRLIIRGFNDDALVAAEAGTGVGKSFAYLLPVMRYALDNDERIVISTATITLQQQLYEKDIPLVSSALGKTIKVVLMKGRGNYLCRRRLEDAIREPSLDEEENDAIASIVAWTEVTKTGSRSDLSFLPPEAVWSRVCSEADTCMGLRCPERDRCFFLALRKECADARILVVNHHLLFADLAARSEGAGYDNTVVLPPYRRVVIDEAHTVESAATSFFSKEFSRLGLYRQLGRLYRKRRAQRAGLLLRLAPLLSSDTAANAETLVDLASTEIQKIRDTADDLDAAALELLGTEGTFRLTPVREEAIAAALIPGLLKLRKGILSLVNKIREMLENLKSDNEDDPTVWEVKAVIRRLEAIGSVCAAFIEYRERPTEVMWMERHGGHASGSDWVQFTATPIDVAPSLKEALFEPNKTVICVSATLTVGNGRSVSGGPADFAYWSSRCGLGLVMGREALTGQFPSPFPYASSVLLAVPEDAPLPDQGTYRGFVDQAAGRLADTAGGSALILFTSYDALRSAYAAARPILEKSGIRCLKQGDDDRTRLLQTFLSDESSVLFATDSFWEGVDAPGDTLRLVILCRLPFKAPNDPVFAARCEAVEKHGGNSFMDLSLPEAVIKFKQGFGRLMRRSSDHGVVAVLDGRLLHKRYGDYFLRSIPKTRTSFAEFSALLRETEDFLFNR